MITIDRLEKIGADTRKGLQLCMGNEQFYLRMVKIGISDPHFDSLQQHLGEKNLKAAFEDAHALKGVLGNLSLTPLYEPICEITDLLRTGKEADYLTMVQPVLQLRNTLMQEL